MINSNQLVPIDLTNHKKIEQELSQYTSKVLDSSGEIKIKIIKNPYFLLNDRWEMKFVEKIPQFTSKVKERKAPPKDLKFQTLSPGLNIEFKYIWYRKLFDEQWSIRSLFEIQPRNLVKLTEFLNEKYPTLNSLLDINLKKAEYEWFSWLTDRGIKLKAPIKNYHGYYLCQTPTAKFLSNMYETLMKITDTREEWEKDRWDVRNLNHEYGITYNKSRSDYILDFSTIKHQKFKREIQRYFKMRMLSKKNFAWSTAGKYLNVLSNFIACICSQEPEWSDLKRLRRCHLENYIKWINKHISMGSKKKNIMHPERFINYSINIIERFIEDIQRYEFEIAPEANVRQLIYREDKPKLRKISMDQIDYIPDFVLEQLFEYIEELPSEVIPVIWIAFKTGMRISDVLGLDFGCLEYINGNYSIVTDIEKTYVKGHRIPIDEGLAQIVAEIIHQIKGKSTKENNPNELLFIRHEGKRKGMPFTQAFIREQLNILAKKKNIVSEDGQIFHFKTHQFRHTYAVKLLNNGVDIITIQELLAHASPEMTMRYAKLHDDTKRKAFEGVLKTGVFSFNSGGSIREIKNSEEIPDNILQALWQNHKLNAMDNPYGTCHARLKGNCPHMENPPCLTCNNGRPCKDLAIGLSNLDKEKYELHIKTTEKSIEVAKQYDRLDIVEKQKFNLEQYCEILENIQQGNIIFGRQNRAKGSRL